MPKRDTARPKARSTEVCARLASAPRQGEVDVSEITLDRPFSAKTRSGLWSLGLGKHIVPK